MIGQRGSGLSPAVVTGICVVVLLIASVPAAVFIYQKRRARRKETENNHDQSIKEEDRVDYAPISITERGRSSCMIISPGTS
ncbi:hypothetical protein ROHU_025772 [Labeo rohita]|uniref:Uncharacterized protein n=1 Tax=Labeo rohita TaxID=84645 RepID=A0A498MH03_LABRO|nr:hypothetical protein ROHU_025772 [Labeo rohita]